MKINRATASKCSPEFFYPKGPYKSMATPYEVIEKKRRRRERLSDILDTVLYAVALGVAGGAIMGLYYAWNGIILA